MPKVFASLTNPTAYGLIRDIDVTEAISLFTTYFDECCRILTISFGVPSALAVNKVLSLDGDGDYVRVADSDVLFTDNTFTIEAWFNIRSVGDELNTILANDEYEIHISGASKIFVWDNGADSFEGTTTIQTNIWYHVAFVNDGTGRRIFLNGILDGQSESSSPLGNAPQELWIGNDPQPPSRHFSGLIDEVRIWNVARTQEEIRENINQPIENPDLLENLVGYWNFDDDTANDLSKYGNDGTMQDDAIIVESERAKVIFVPDDYTIIQDGIDAANPGDIVVLKAYPKTARRGLANPRHAEHRLSAFVTGRSDLPIRQERYAKNEFKKARWK